jgi:hypothetical protein
MNENDPENWTTPVYTQVNGSDVCLRYSLYSWFSLLQQWGHIGLMFIIYLFVPESPGKSS